MDLDRNIRNGALFPEELTVSEQLSRMFSLHGVVDGLGLCDRQIVSLCSTNDLFKESGSPYEDFFQSLAWPEPAHPYRSLNSDTKRYCLFLLHLPLLLTTTNSKKESF